MIRTGLHPCPYILWEGIPKGTSFASRDPPLYTDHKRIKCRGGGSIPARFIIISHFFEKSPYYTKIFLKVLQKNKFAFLENMSKSEENRVFESSLESKLNFAKKVLTIVK